MFSHFVYGVHIHLFMAILDINKILLQLQTTLMLYTRLYWFLLLHYLSLHPVNTANSDGHSIWLFKRST